MLIQLTANADLDRVKAQLVRLGLWCETLAPEPDLGGNGGAQPNPRIRALRVADHSRAVSSQDLQDIDGVASVWVSASAHPLVDEQAGAPVRVGPITLGTGRRPVLMAGPCAVESPELIERAAALAAHAGAALLRGGAFKPRTSPRSFRGHGNPALAWLRDAADRHGLGVVTEVMSERDVGVVAEAADLLQVGSRNMQNFALLEAVGSARKAVLLKRGVAANLDDWLMAAEHLMVAGCPAVIFCERGIATRERRSRNLLDVTAVALMAGVMRQPVVVDPSHAAGRRDLVLPLARAGLAAGAHGLLVEVHPDAARALSDGPQALNAEELDAVGRLVAVNATPNETDPGGGATPW